MADQVDGRMGNGRWPNRKRNTPSRFAPPAANPDDVSEPHEKRQKISSTDYVSKAAEQPGPTTPNDEPVTPPVKDAANKRHRTPKPNLPLTPQSSPAETLQAGGSISEGIEKYFVAGKPDGDAAQVGTSAPSSHPEPDLENNVSAGKKKQAGKKTANTGGKKSGISKKPDTRPLPSGEPPVWALVSDAVLQLPSPPTHDINRVGKLFVRLFPTTGPITLPHTVTMDYAMDFCWMVVEVCAAIWTRKSSLPERTF